MSAWTLWQAAWCTETPEPRVMKPTISSPGTGVQHRASFTRMSGAPRTSTPESLFRGSGRERVEMGMSGSSSPSSTSRTSATTFSSTDWVET